MIQCINCKEIKSEEEFYNRGKCKARPNRTGKSTECKICVRLRSKKNSNPKSKRYHMVKFKFGILKEEYDNLLKKFPVCAICKNEFKKNEPHVDHCHRTGKIRGLLCGNHNVGLGMFNDDPKLLLAAFEYLTNSLAADCPTITKDCRVFQQLTQF